jgi:hypothetical protein
METCIGKDTLPSDIDILSHNQAAWDRQAAQQCE